MLDIIDEATRDAERLATRIRDEDYESLKKYWADKNYLLITSYLRRYGIEFKGLTYLENLMEQLIKKREREIEA